jgi:hypothetical protein
MTATRQLSRDADRNRRSARRKGDRGAAKSRQVRARAGRGTSVCEHFDAERVCIPQMRRLLQPEGMASLPETPDEPRTLSEATGAVVEVNDRDQREEKPPSAKDVLRNPFA